MCWVVLYANIATQTSCEAFCAAKEHNLTEAFSILTSLPPPLPRSNGAHTDSRVKGPESSGTDSGVSGVQQEYLTYTQMEGLLLELFCSDYQWVRWSSSTLLTSTSHDTKKQSHGPPSSQPSSCGEHYTEKPKPLHTNTILSTGVREEHDSSTSAVHIEDIHACILAIDKSHTGYVYNNYTYPSPL